MAENFTYQGKELELFGKARHWKRYMTRFISPHISGRVLEAGAGLGNTTEWMRNSAHQEWILLEPDPVMADFLKNKVSPAVTGTKCTVINGTIEDAGPAFYDTIIYIDVLEHIADDKGEIAKAAALLNTGGKLIVLSPAFQFLFSPFDAAVGHFRRYSKQELQQICGPLLKKQDLRYLDTAGFFSSVLNKVLLRQQYPTAKQIALWDSCLVPISAVTDRLCMYSFGKSLLGIWQK